MTQTGPQGFGPDFLRGMMPPEIRERLGVMNAWPLRMVLAYVDGQAPVLADYAQRIATYDDDPVVAAGQFAGKYPGTRYSFAVDRTMDLIGMMLDAAGIRGAQITNAEAVVAVRRLVSDLVPVEDRDETLAVVNRQPATGGFGGWQLDHTTAGRGELYVVTALAAWMVDHPLISPSKQASRRMILRQLHDLEATGRGVPEAERLEVTDQQALDLLDAVLGRADPNLPDFGAPGQAAITRDPHRRSLVEMEVVEATKAHLIEHPIRTEDTDRLLLAAISRAMDGTSTRRNIINAATARHENMTDTERNRAAKLAEREARRATGERPKKRKHR